MQKTLRHIGKWVPEGTHKGKKASAPGSEATKKDGEKRELETRCSAPTSVGKKEGCAGDAAMVFGSPQSKKKKRGPHRTAPQGEKHSTGGKRRGCQKEFPHLPKISAEKGMGKDAVDSEWGKRG